MSEAEFAAVQAALAETGVDGRDLARFANRPYPGVIEPETFDAAAALPVLLEWLPRVQGGAVRETLARRVAQGARRQAEKRAAAPILAALLRQETDESTAWAIGDALSRTLVPDVYEEFLTLAADRRLGTARQMLVYSLWRVKDPRAGRIVEISLDDEDVCLHAIHSLRRMSTREAAAARLRALAASENDVVAANAARELRKLERAA